RTDVARVQPSVGIDRLGGGNRIVVIAFEDVRPAYADLAVAGDTYLGTGNDRAGLSSSIMSWRGDRRDGRALAHAIHFADRQTEREEELERARRDGRGPVIRVLARSKPSRFRTFEKTRRSATGYASGRAAPR